MTNSPNVIIAYCHIICQQFFGKLFSILHFHIYALKSTPPSVPSSFPLNIDVPVIIRNHPAQFPGIIRNNFRFAVIIPYHNIPAFIAPAIGTGVYRQQHNHNHQNRWGVLIGT